MAYRKITVEGKIYEYVIGHTFVKIKGVGVYIKEEIGEECDMYCRCGLCDGSVKLEDVTGRKEVKVRVCPSHIEKLIKAHNK